MDKLKVALFGDDPARLEEVYDSSRRARIAGIADLHPRVVSSASFDDEAAALADVRALFCTWGMPALSVAQIARLPRLEALFYAAGSVRGFAPAFLERGVRVSSAWDANAVPVAEFAFSQIVLSCKGFFRNTREVRALQGARGKGAFSGPGCYGETVALLGAGRVARRLLVDARAPGSQGDGLRSLPRCRRGRAARRREGVRSKRPSGAGTWSRTTCPTCPRRPAR